MKKILICGLSRAGKTTLARELQTHLPFSVTIDGDDVRKMYGNDLGFSKRDRLVQATRMRELADSFKESASYVIASFICPTNATREAFQPDYIIYVKNPDNRVCLHPDTSDMFQIPANANHIVASDDATAESRAFIQNCLSFKFGYPTALFIGRFQPFHDGHKQLVLKGMEKLGVDQACIGVRDMIRDDKNPFSYDYIKCVIYSKMRGHKIEVMQVPNIRGICYGRDVGYDVIQIGLDPEIEKISGTQIRKELEKGSKIDVTA